MFAKSGSVVVIVNTFGDETEEEALDMGLQLIEAAQTPVDWF